MPTIIAKKIRADISHGNFARMRALIDYCSSPENSQGNEKCVFFRAVNFSGDEDDMTIQEIKDELAYDFSITKYRKDDVEKFAHWVLSLKRTDNNDKYHDIETLYSAAKDFIMNLGFDDNHKFTIVIHADADHIHIYICISKVNEWTGKIVREGNGWYKNQGQKALAIIAHKYGFGLEKGARYGVRPVARQELVKIGDKEISRPQVTRIQHDMDNLKSKSLSREAYYFEKRTGMKSEQRLLQEDVLNFFDKYKDEMKNWKVGDLHKYLAQYGLSCQRIKNENFYGLTFSRDGKIWFKAGDIAAGLTYTNLLKRLNVKDAGSWRDARPHAQSICQQVRDMRPKDHRELLETREQDTPAQKQREKFRVHMVDVPVPARFTAIGNRAAQRLQAKGVDARRLPLHIARALAAAGAKPDEIYSYLMNRDMKGVSQEEQARRARRAVFQALPVRHLGRGHRWVTPGTVRSILSQRDNVPPLLASIINMDVYNPLPKPKPVKSKAPARVVTSRPVSPFPSTRPAIPAKAARTGRPVEPIRPVQERPPRRPDTEQPVQPVQPVQQPVPEPEDNTPSFGMSM